MKHVPSLAEMCPLQFLPQSFTWSPWWFRKDKSHSIVLDSVYPALQFLRTLMPQHTTVVKMRQNKGVVKLCLGINWQNIPQPSYLRESIKTLPSHISNVVSPSQTVINPHPQALQLHHRLSLQLAYITDSESLWSSASVQDSVQSVHNPVHESSPESRVQRPPCTLVETLWLYSLSRQPDSCQR